MKKIIIVLVAIIICVGIFIGIKMNNVPNVENKNTETSVEVEEPIEWNANFIWNDSNDNNSWMCFRKKVDIREKDLKKGIKAQIAVDSKYWLYINGELVVRDGAVKRGEVKDATIYYDNIDITDYLHSGENTIAILAWYWGDTSMSHNSSGQAGLYFQAKIGRKYLTTDETWKVKRNEAYLQDSLRPNKRLIEYNVYYDSKLAIDDWYMPDYDDTTWENAKVLALAGAIPWGEMIPRNIPMFVDDDKITEYENISDYNDYTTTKDETLEMIVPYNTQLTPYLKIETQEPSLKITIKTDTYEDVSGDSVMCTYLTKEGIQEFESLPWMNGEKVYYEIPKGVKIISLGYRKTGYDSKATGSFKSDDEFMNKLWQMAETTLYVNMRDSYMDCPNRERAQWWGDMAIEMMEAMYSLDTNAYSLYEKGVKTTFGWSEDGKLYTVVPNTDDNGNMNLPVQMFAGIVSMYEYYEYTGKTEFLELVYPHIKEYLELWQVDGNTGLMQYVSTGPMWQWGDSVAECDYNAIENAWYYYALSKVEKMAEILKYDNDVTDLKAKMTNLKDSYNKLWTPNGYKSTDSKMIDERANAVAVLSGIADSEKYSTIKKVLTKDYQATVYMENYVLNALCEMGYITEAQDRIKDRYDEMVNGKNACSTLWENWKLESGTKNHAWAGGPLVVMSKYFAGIKPLKKGYDEILIKPQFGNLNKISANVTTIKGDTKLNCEKLENELTIKLNVPSKTLIAIEKMSDDVVIKSKEKTIYENNKEVSNKDISFDHEDDNYVYFYIEKGKYTFLSK